MRHENRQLVRTSDRAQRASLELISFDKPFASYAERSTILEYVESLSKELADLSSKADLPFVAYLFNLARLEAEESRRDPVSECSL
jgi:hypothetical protein